MGLAMLMLAAAFNAHAEPSVVECRGYPAHSREPWGAFLGKVAHVTIANEYRRAHSRNTIFTNNVRLYEIVIQARLGDVSRLAEYAKGLCPDITDTSDRVLLEIKPDNEDARKQGREQAGSYLTALNEAVQTGDKLVGGTGFEGTILIRFGDGRREWKLTWRTPEAGVTLYRWSYKDESKEKPRKEIEARKEEELTERDIQESEKLVEQVLEAAYNGGERPKGFKGQVYLPVECP